MRDLELLTKLIGVDEIRIHDRVGGWAIGLRLGSEWISTEILLTDLAGVKDQERELGRTITALAEVLKRGKRESFAVLGGTLKPPHPPISGRGFTRGCMCSDCLERETESELRRPINRFEAVAEELKKL